MGDVAGASQNLAVALTLLPMAVEIKPFSVESIISCRTFLTEATKG
jgi:hypothetical protein